MRIRPSQGERPREALQSAGGGKLVKLGDLAPLWDGYALFLSARPFNVDAILTADR